MTQYHKIPVNNIQRLEQEHQEPKPQNTNIKQSKKSQFLQFLYFERVRNSTNTCFEFYLNDYQCKNRGRKTAWLSRLSSIKTMKFILNCENGRFYM